MHEAPALVFIFGNDDGELLLEELQQQRPVFEPDVLAEEIAAYAAQAGCPAAAIADPHSLVGAIEFAKACRRNGVKPLIGASIELPEGGEIVLIARSKRGYVSLSRLVTECHLGEPRSFPLGS